MPEKIKLKKTLYIGLGGTGVATLLRVKNVSLIATERFLQ